MSAIRLLGCLTATVVAALSWQHRPPVFEDFPVGRIYRGRPAPVDLSSAAGARRFRTVLRQGARTGPNFAGHYTVITWGCGTECQQFAIADARNGHVYLGSFSVTLGAS